MYTITIQGLEKLEASLSRASDVSNSIFKRAMEQSLTEVTNMAKQNAPVLTGKLRRSIHPVMKNVLQGEVSTGTEYAAYVEFGTRPHVIVPKRAKVLAFRSGGSMVFTKRVNHPGFPGRFYMRKTAKEAVGVIKRIYENAFSQLVKVVFGG